ncbi:golgi uridine diphosphate-N- acetylglucosamine transporter [Cadophora gregata]|uniref:golgi uridine diphosphate-N- acetylglucosamine transporter n=1 Tax=Cadophora gregata TaxID=51156 RepID=UPI0026DBBF0A|nr:golgi uridine diphosphate-N- acetylglucosamine transporter [Cadophora gregata]KAK0122281.1 golgi uridine diphosphate-N- acetylglucosamine transporter [Cadophora gregata]KAK0127756.1 golgi uridine diphosphate-N- acetylglucosamine transporter [Cadophora gregata f. sp. sojae]
MSTPRRRSTLRDLQASTTNADGDIITPKIIDARPSLEKAEMYGIDDPRPTSSRIMALIGRIFIETIPQWLAVGAMLGLIFGGCCSNVFALEAIVKVEPASGTLLTFVQFLFVATTGYFSQFDRSRPPFFLKPNHVPIKRWLINILLFFTINVLNNHAFSYNISVPIHIILRSGGSITTIAAGYLWGKRFSRMQVFAVTLLTVGVVIAAWSDQQSKVCKTELRNWIYIHKILARSGGVANPSSVQQRARHPFLCPGSVRNHGLVYRGNIQTVRTTLEGELVLFSSPSATSIHALPPFNEETVLETCGITTFRAAGL